MTPSERTAAWRKANPEKERALRQRLNERRRGTRQAESRAQYLRRMAEDPEKVRRQRREWQQSPLGRAYLRADRSRRRNARVTDSETLAYIQILIEDPCSYCGGTGTEIDHIVPLAEGGSGHWSNLTASCRSCNASKNDRSLLRYLEETV